jgi:hypothetical protein
LVLGRKKALFEMSFFVRNNLILLLIIFFCSGCGVVWDTIGANQISFNCQSPSSLSGAFAAGNGTPANPFIICSLTQLSNAANNISASYALGTNIDASSIAQWTPIGSNATPFSGTFNGNGYTVSNITNTTGASYVGLFGDITGTVLNLNVTNVTITGIGCPVGTLSGSVEAGGIIQTCSGTGSISGNGCHMGGLVGYNDGTISNSWSSASITAGVCGSAGFGGLVGHNDGTVNTSFATGSVTITWFCGGPNNNFGGLVGVCNGTINNSYAKGAVTGLAGAGTAGGLVGSLGGTVNTSYSIGAVSSTAPFGGLIGSSAGIVNSSYWPTDISGQAASAGGTASTSAAMQVQGTFTGFDFVTPIWKFKVSIQPYPVLFWE